MTRGEGKDGIFNILTNLGRNETSSGAILDMKALEREVYISL